MYQIHYLNRRNGRVWQIPTELVGNRLRATRQAQPRDYETAQEIADKMNQILALRGTAGKCFAVYFGE